MKHNEMYQACYESSWALIVGINKYQKINSLDYACNDAEAIAKILQEKFGFSNSNISLLLDDEATRDNVIHHFLKLRDTVKEDDRIIFFFAGHGYTVRGNRSEVGFLVPVDGCPNDLSTLIRWDELTCDADLITAKHILFIMDACYGGLAVTRHVPPGSMRFLESMMQRYARQVLTAGKADEVVADANGPRVGHSIFTGHLLNGLDGAAATSDGILTANKVMAYVYDQVAKDSHSNQTPHYGFIEGDGDFIFNPPSINASAKSNEDNILISIPSTLIDQETGSAFSKIDRFKEFLSEGRHRIKLNDFIEKEIRSIAENMGSDRLSVHATPIDAEATTERIRLYEEITSDMLQYSALMGKWAQGIQISSLEDALSRLVDINTQRSGVTRWLNLRWYPLQLLLYATGIASWDSGNYEVLARILTTSVQDPENSYSRVPIIVPTVQAMMDLDRNNVFKIIPGYDNRYVPRSDYMFQTLQPILDDVLRLGSKYEFSFDKFGDYSKDTGPFSSCSRLM